MIAKKRTPSSRAIWPIQCPADPDVRPGLAGDDEDIEEGYERPGEGGGEGKPRAPLGAHQRVGRDGRGGSFGHGNFLRAPGLASAPYANRPPSIGKAAPVMNDASSLHRNATNAATSSGSP